MSKSADKSVHSQYTHDKKKKLAEKISKIRRKDIMIKIFEIIYADNKDITQNANGVFMFFHKLKDTTYEKIEDHLKKCEAQRKRKLNADGSSPCDSDSTEQREFVPYTQEEFPGQEGMSPKLKFSNKEKNLIKRKRYDRSLTNETKNDVKYCEFDPTQSDSEHRA